MPNSLSSALGLLILLLVAYDVYATILHARKRPGPISNTLNRAVWLVMRFVAHGMEAALRNAARELQCLSESHIEHPVIHYFHSQEVYKSLPRMLFLSLEICSIIRSCLDQESYPETHDNPDVGTLQASARHMLGQMIDALGLERDTQKQVESHFEESRRWRHRFQQTMRQLNEAGISTNPDTVIAFEQYSAQRQEWETRLHRFALFLGYDWDEVTGDGDLQYAADEGMATPQTN